MKRIFIFAISILFVLPISAAKKEKVQQVDSLGRKIKTGWNFGALPSVAFDADLGFQGGALANIYYYGDGSQYPEYIHSLYVEAAYTTKRYGIFRANYDSKYLIPKHRLTLDATYQPDAMCDFYGFNGYQSVYNQDFHKWKKDPAKMGVVEDYQSRAFYKYKRDLFRFAADIEGTIWKNIKWNAGVGVLGYMIDECDIDMLNGKKNVFDPTLKRYEQKAMNKDVEGLYEKYVKWGLIDQAEAQHPRHALIADDDIPRLHVAVQKSGRMSRLQSQSHLAHNLQRICRQQITALRHNQLQVAPLHQLHGNIELPARASGRIYRDHILMAHLGHEGTFILKTCHTFRLISVCLIQHLDGQRASQHHIGGTEHHTHPPDTQHRIQPEIGQQVVYHVPRAALGAMHLGKEAGLGNILPGTTGRANPDVGMITHKQAGSSGKSGETKKGDRGR